MADAVVSALLEKLLTLLLEEGQQLLELDDQFDKMTNELRYMKTCLKDAETVRRKDGREILKVITQDLRELVYDAEDIIADCQVFLKKKQHDGCLADFMSYCSPRLLKFRHKITKRLKITNQEIAKVQERMRRYLAMFPAPIISIGESSRSRPLSYPILMQETDIVGLTEQSKDVEKLILEADGSPIVIGIVGMGGIGKTTLAQKICNRNAIKHSFKCIIFETISQHCELEDLLKRMLTKMNVGEACLKGKEVVDLLEKLRSKLEEEKYLVVLDDVWENEMSTWWDSLNSALPKRNGCCVIVTTRNEDVAKSMGAIDRHINRPQILSDDDSWSLFTKIAFARDGGRCPNSSLESIGKEIVVRCGGLPLAIKVVGGMMLGKGDSIHEWRRIAQHLKEEMVAKKKDEPLMLSLGLSYEELPPYLKPCLICFSMLPEDYSIDVEDIVRWWIGEGFVLGSERRTAFEIGRQYVAELVNRCVLIGADKDLLTGQLCLVKMHDIVRDMIIKIARDENFTHLDERGRPELTVQSRRMGMFSNGRIKSIERTELKKSTSESKLRTLWALHIGKEDVLSKNMELCKLKRLRVLSVSFKIYLEDEEFMKDWLDGIASLLHLVYLKIEDCGLKNLPDSVGNLPNLQILCLFNWKFLKMLPPTITKLDKLTFFVIEDCDDLECMPDGIERLSRLVGLTFVCPTISSHKNTSRICHLKNLGQLRELFIDLKNPNSLVEGELNVLSELQNLRNLVITFSPADADADAAALASKVNHQLSPLRNVEELGLFNYPGESTPIWLNATTFPNLQFLLLYEGHIKHMDPGFWAKEHGVWKIEGVLVLSLPNFEEKGERFCEALPSLKELMGIDSDDDDL